MRVARTERFKRAYRKLSLENRDRARKAIRLATHGADELRLWLNCVLLDA